jgi:predicted DNA-binding transcriptional regulator AlpA
MTPAHMTDWSAQPLWLDLARVAALFGVSERSIRNRLAKRQFPSPMFVRPLRWSRADLEAFWKGSSAASSRSRRSA